MDFLLQVDSRIDIVKNQVSINGECFIVLISRTNPLVPDVWFDGQP